jgi:uncharacterized membrane protein YadS
MADQNKAIGLKLLRTEDYWAIWLGLLVILVSVAAFWGGTTIASWAVKPGTWSSIGELAAGLGKNISGIFAIYVGLGVVFTFSMKLMGHNIKHFVIGYSILFVGSVVVFYLAAWSGMKKVHLGAPLLALLIGLVVGNLRSMPEWFKTALRTEYYIKTGIVLLGATLPLTLIAKAGPIAFVQATIVSVCTWLTIYLAATRIFKLDPRFGAVLGTGGAVCGVSGSIAVGGAVRADKDHIAIGIAVVSVWAIVMILVLAVLTKVMIPPAAKPAGGSATPAAEVVVADSWKTITPAEAGAWVGTSEYADAAGFAVVAEIAEEHGDAAIYAFTLMKVIGRDIWIGIWAFVLSIISVVFWERNSGSADGPRGKVGIAVVWERFPKFVIGFFAACITMSAIAAAVPEDHVGRAPVSGTFKSKAQKAKYQADFAAYAVPPELADRFAYDADAGVISFTGEMSLADLELLSRHADPQQKWAIKNLHHRSDWLASELQPKVISPIKNLRSWAFVLCFLCIGLSTRFRDLATFGLAPFWAFTIGVLINVPLGFFLTTQVFVRYWQGLH